MISRRYLVESRWLGLAVVTAIGVLLRFANLAGVPGGFFHDEAWSAAKAWSLVKGEAALQVYFAENNGMDAAHVYGIAALFALTGPLAIGSRIVSSLMGSLSILATYWVTWELLADERRRHTLSLIAAFVVATLFWALTTSRSAWHVPWMTLTVTLCLAALFRGRRLARRRWFVVAGVLAGLAQYTYPSARFLPLLLLAIGALDASRNRAARRKVVVDYLVLLAVAAVVFAPLGVYFIQHPEWFFVRAQQTTDVLATDLGQNVVKTLAGFSIYGDDEGLHNLPGRPALDPILSVFFIVGLVFCVARRRAAHLILIAWLIVFSLPVVLTGQAPLFRRWTGILPAEAMIVAVGVVGLAQVARDRRVVPAIRSLGPAVIAAALIASASLSIADYFGPYATSPHMFWAYDSGMTQVANYLRSRPDAVLFLTPYDRFYEVVAITLAEGGRPPIQSYNGLACAVFPERTDRETEWVVITETDDRTLSLMQQIFPTGRIVWQIDSPTGSYARVLRVPAGQAAQFDLGDRRQADLGGKIRLAGFDRPQRVMAGGTLSVNIALQNLAPLDQTYKVFVHLRGPADAVFAQSDRVPCNFTLNEADWRPGNIVLETYDLPIPVETPPDTYRVMLGMYPLDSGARLPVTESELDHTPDSILLGRIEVQR